MVFLSPYQLLALFKAYWREQGYSGEVVSNGGGPMMGCSSGPISILYDATTDNQVPALVGFIAGRPGVEWHRKTVWLTLQKLNYDVLFVTI